jgi:hypothetical protein
LLLLLLLSVIIIIILLFIIYNVPLLLLHAAQVKNWAAAYESESKPWQSRRTLAGRCVPRRSTRSTSCGRCLLSGPFFFINMCSVPIRRLRHLLFGLLDPHDVLCDLRGVKDLAQAREDLVLVLDVLLELGAQLLYQLGARDEDLAVLVRL